MRRLNLNQYSLTRIDFGDEKQSFILNGRYFFVSISPHPANRRAEGIACGGALLYYPEYVFHFCDMAKRYLNFLDRNEVMFFRRGYNELSDSDAVFEAGKQLLHAISSVKEMLSEIKASDLLSPYDFANKEDFLHIISEHLFRTKCIRYKDYLGKAEIAWSGVESAVVRLNDAEQTYFNDLSKQGKI